MLFQVGTIRLLLLYFIGGMLIAAKVADIGVMSGSSCACNNNLLTVCLIMGICTKLWCYVHCQELAASWYHPRCSNMFVEVAY